MLPMLEKEAVEKKKWIDRQELLDYYAVAQCTPGIIASNTASLIGYRVGGASGAVAASLGVVAPSYVIITLIAAFLSGFMDFAAVQHSLAGVQACVAALILSSLVKLWKNSVCDWLSALFFAAALAASVVFDLSPVAVVAAAALGGVVKEIRKGGTAR